MIGLAFLAVPAGGVSQTFDALSRGAVTRAPVAVARFAGRAECQRVAVVRLGAPKPNKLS